MRDPVVVVEVEMVSVPWLLSIDRSLPGTLRLLVGCAWAEPGNREWFLQAGRSRLTDAERALLRTTYGLDNDLTESTAVTAQRLPECIEGRRPA
jgi:hypothetical protein